MRTLVVSMTVLLLTPASGADEPGEALSAARALIDAGKAAEAVARLQPLDRSDPRVGHLLGLAHYHAGDAARAAEVLAPVVDKLPEGSPERREAVQVLGLSLYLAGRIAESIPYLEKTRLVTPDHHDLLYVLGMAYLQTGQPAKAREVWAHAFGVKSDTAAASLLTAQMMVRAGLDEAAEAELKQALARDPRLPYAHFLLGQSALFRGRLDESVTLLQRELELNPGNAMALYRLGDAYTRQGKWDEAIAALQRSVWINPFYSGPYILLGKAHGQKGNPGAAEVMLRRAVQYDPNNKTAHYLLAQLLQRTGRADEARREFETAERLQDAVDR
jgi:tetratricopeptide (TPR) repeat protein